jgi:NADH:ubiquinone oxidoreductase subunit 6 (subunit J)
MIESQETPQTILASSSAAETPQFAKAEYANTPGTDRCGLCGSALSGEYYRVNNQMACSTCAGQAKAGQPTDSHVAYARAALFGIGGALAGLALYSTVEIVTTMTIGYLALAVGWLVAKAMMTGSKGIGGTRYQITAVLLTYLAISMSAIPVGISYIVSHRHDKAAQVQSDQSQQATDGSTENDAQATNDSASRSSGGAPRDQSTGNVILRLLFFGIASPFLELASPGSGIIGLVILFVGLSIAFRMTKATPLDVDGPYELSKILS